MMVVSECARCNSRILTHSKVLRCSLCMDQYHLQCLPFISSEDSIYINREVESWFCIQCSAHIYPFNHFDDDTEFRYALTENICDKMSSTLEQLNEMIFNPFDINDDDTDSPLCNLDPDYNYYNMLNNISNSCDYYLEESFKTKINNRQTYKDCFSLISHNIRSIPKNFTDFLSYIKLLNFTFTCYGFTETWLKNSNCLLYNIDGYNAIHECRDKKMGGGVSLYIKSGLEYKCRPDLELNNDFIESCFIELDKKDLHYDKNVILGVIYRPPNTNPTEFNKVIYKILKVIKTEKKLIYLIGDYNLNLLNSDNHTQTSEFLNIMYMHSLFPIINKTTRITTKTATLIDNIYCNDVTNNHMFQGL